MYEVLKLHIFLLHMLTASELLKMVSANQALNIRNLTGNYSCILMKKAVYRKLPVY